MRNLKDLNLKHNNTLTFSVTRPLVSPAHDAGTITPDCNKSTAGLKHLEKSVVAQILFLGIVAP
jgi:hypothetical protein